MRDFYLNSFEAVQYGLIDALTLPNEVLMFLTSCAHLTCKNVYCIQPSKIKWTRSPTDANKIGFGHFAESSFIGEKYEQGPIFFLCRLSCVNVVCRGAG
jgi:hypothetical protein